MNRQIILTIMAAILLPLPITIACAESSQTPPTLSWIAETEQATQWAEILGFVQPLESLRVTQGYAGEKPVFYKGQNDCGRIRRGAGQGVGFCHSWRKR